MIMKKNDDYNDDVRAVRDCGDRGESPQQGDRLRPHAQREGGLPCRQVGGVQEPITDIDESMTTLISTSPDNSGI